MKLPEHLYFCKGDFKDERQYTGENIFIFDAAEGMVLSQDIMTSTGHLIAAKDTVLTLDMIAKISEYNVLKINVYEEAAAQPEQPEVLEQMTYYEKLSRARISNILTKLLLMVLMI